MRGGNLDGCMGIHFMSEWGEPEYVNQALAQRRQCTRCNLVEYRSVSILVPKEDS